MGPRVFIGSSTENLNIAYAIQQNIEKDSEPTVWNQNIFDLSSYTLDSLIKQIEEFDFGIFVFSPDDIANIRNKEKQIVRDNIVLELGLFIGRLGKERTFIIVPQGIENFQLPTDLLGLTIAEYNPKRKDNNLEAALGPACNKIRNSLKGTKEISTSYDSPIDSAVGLKEIIPRKIESIQKDPTFLLDAKDNIWILGTSLRTIFWNGNPFRKYLELAGKKNVMIKILLLNPKSEHVEQKAKEETLDEVTYRSFIDISIRELINSKNNGIPRMELYLYDEFPVWNMIIIDNIFAKISYFPTGKDGGEAPYYVFDGNGDFNLIKPFKIYLDKLIERSREVKYLFNWYEIPGKDNLILKNILIQNFNIDWVNKAEIDKIDPETIKVFTDEKFLCLRLNGENTKIFLTIDDNQIDEFYVIMEKNMLNIYK